MMTNFDKHSNDKLRQESQVDSDQNGSSFGKNSRSSRMLFIVFVSLVVDLLAFTVILPLLPSLLEHYGTDRKDWLYRTVVSQVDAFQKFLGMPDTDRFTAVLFGGIIGSLFSLLQFLCCPLMGATSDIFGRRLPMLWSMAGVLLSYIVWACSGNFTLFVASRILGGLSKGNTTICTAVVTDITTPKTRAKGMALIGIAYSIGFIIGPVIGALFASSSARSSVISSNPYLLPSLLAITLVTLDLVFVYCLFEETLPVEKRAKSVLCEMKNALHLINPVSLFRFAAVEQSSAEDLKKKQTLGLVYFLYLFFFSGLEFTLTFLTHRNFQYTSMKQGMMFFYIGIMMAVVQGGYVRRLPAGSEKKTAIRGMIATVPGMILVGVAKSVLTLYLGLAFFSFGAATVVPCLTSLISKYGSDDQKGKIMGIFRSIGALARAVGPFVACTLYWSIGSFWCYCIGAVMFALPIYLLHSYNDSSKKDD